MKGRAGGRASAASQALQAGIEHHQAGRLVQADALYRQALQADPDHPQALHLLGMVAVQCGEHAEAVECFRRVAAVVPDSADAHCNLGNALVQAGKFEEAAAALNEALKLDPKHALAHNNLGNALMHLGRAAEAAESFRRAVALEPAHAQAHFNLGNSLRDAGQLEEAAASLQAALRLQPRFAEAHGTLGSAYSEMGRLDEAAAAMKAALQCKPDYLAAQFNLHAVLLDTEGPAPAIRCLERAMQLAPQDRTVRFYLGLLLDHAGNAEAARAHFDVVAAGDATDRARLDAWRYLQGRTISAALPLAGTPVRVFEIALQAARQPGLVLEFGVRFGASIRQIAGLAGQPVHGFDSFEGIPEDWHGEPRGSYSTQGVLPRVPANVSLHAGWFEDSLPRFLAAHPGPVRFMNVDCDLYSSTRTVLEALAERIVPGSVIVFDEYIGYEQWREDEFRAFQEFISRTGRHYEYLCFSFATKQVAVRML